MKLKHSVSIYLLATLSILLFFDGRSPSQEFNLSGVFHDLSPGWVNKIYLLKVPGIQYALSGSDEFVIDSAEINEKGAFAFSNPDSIGDNTLYRLNVIPKEKNCCIGSIIMNGTVENCVFVILNKTSNIFIEADLTHFAYSANYKVADEQNKELYKFLWLRRKQMEAYDPYVKTLSELRKKGQVPPDSLKSFRKNIDKVNSVYFPRFKSFCDTTKYFFASLLATRYFDYASDTSFYLKLDDRYQNEMPGSPYSKQFHSELENKLYFLPIGSPAPEIILPDSNGIQRKLSDFKGKLILVDFWASWCMPCRQENRETVKPLYDTFHSQGFDVISISQDTEKSKWLKAVKADKLMWTQLCDFSAFRSKACVDYRIRSLPTTYLISGDGKILAKNLKGQDLIDFVTAKLKK